MKNIKKTLFALSVLIFPSVVFATDYVLCGNNRKFPLVIADIFSILFTIVKIFVPIILVFSGMISFFKVVIAGNVDDEMKKAKTKLINKIIAAVMIFFIFSIFNTVVSFVLGSKSDVMSCVKCLTNSKSCAREEGGTRMCPGLLEDQYKYDENCNLKPEYINK